MHRARVAVTTVVVLTVCSWLSPARAQPEASDTRAPSDAGVAPAPPASETTESDAPVAAAPEEPPPQLDDPDPAGSPTESPATPDEPLSAPEAPKAPETETMAPWPAQTAAPKASVAAALAFLRRPSDVQVMCQPADILLQEDTVYVACGTLGVWVLRFRGKDGFTLVEQVHVDGAAVGLWLREGELQVEVAATASASLEEYRRNPTPMANDTCAGGPVRRARRDGLQLLLVPARRHCLRWREHVALLDKKGNRLAVARVHRSHSDSVAVRVGYHEGFDAGEVRYMRATDSSLTSPMAAPLRGGGMWIARGSLGALLGSARGITSDLSLEYVFERPAFVRVEAAPLAWSKGDPVSFAEFNAGPDRAKAASFVAYGGLDLRYFALGLGLGASRINLSDFAVDPGFGTTISVSGRAGSRDGFYIHVRGDTTVYYGRGRLSHLAVKLNLPLTHRGSLQLRGRGGKLGVQMGEFAGRLMLSGDGGPGSTFIEWFLGGGSLQEDGCSFTSTSTGLVCTDTGDSSFNGTHFGVGVEQRF